MEPTTLFLVVSGILYGMVRGAKYVGVKHDIICASAMLTISALSFFSDEVFPLKPLGLMLLAVSSGYLIFLLLLKKRDPSTTSP